MNLLCIRNRGTRLGMAWLAIAALLFVQTFPLHMHGHHDHAGASHDHYAEIHAASADESDAAHVEATKIDLSAAAVVKNLKFGDAPVAVLAFFIVLLLPLPINVHRWSIQLESPFTTRGIAFRPPLRAPPL